MQLWYDGVIINKTSVCKPINSSWNKEKQILQMAIEWYCTIKIIYCNLLISLENQKVKQASVSGISSKFYIKVNLIIKIFNQTSVKHKNIKLFTVRNLLQKPLLQNRMKFLYVWISWFEFEIKTGLNRNCEGNKVRWSENC